MSRNKVPTFSSATVHSRQWSRWSGGWVLGFFCLGLLATASIHAQERLRPASAEETSDHQRRHPAYFLPSSTLLLLHTPNLDRTWQELGQWQDQLFATPPGDVDQELASNMFSTRPQVEGNGYFKILNSLRPKEHARSLPLPASCDGPAFFAWVRHQGKLVPVFGLTQDPDHQIWEQLLSQETADDSAAETVEFVDGVAIRQRPKDSLCFFSLEDQIIGVYDLDLCRDVLTGLRQTERTDKDALPTNRSKQQRLPLLINNRLFQRCWNGSRAAEGYSWFFYVDHHKLNRLTKQPDPEEPSDPFANSTYDRIPPKSPEEKNAGVLGWGMCAQLLSDKIRIRHYLPIAQPIPKQFRSFQEMPILSDLQVTGVPNGARELTLLQTESQATRLPDQLRNLSKVWQFFSIRDPIQHLVDRVTIDQRFPTGRTLAWSDWTTTNPQGAGGLQVKLPRQTLRAMNGQAKLKNVVKDLASRANFQSERELQWDSEGHFFRSLFPYHRSTFLMEFFQNSQYFSIVIGVIQSPHSPANWEQHVRESTSVSQRVRETDLWEQDTVGLEEYREDISTSDTDLIAVNRELGHLPWREWDRFVRPESFLPPIRSSVSSPNHFESRPLQEIMQAEQEYHDRKWDWKNLNPLERWWLQARIIALCGQWRNPHLIKANTRTLAGVNRTTTGSLLIKAIIMRPDKDGKPSETKTPARHSDE